MFQRPYPLLCLFRQISDTVSEELEFKSSFNTLNRSFGSSSASTAAAILGQELACLYAATSLNLTGEPYFSSPYRNEPYDAFTLTALTTVGIGR